MLKDFKVFISRGNVIDLAVGVIIGAAFGKIVSAVVDDVIMPPIGKMVGNLHSPSLFIDRGVEFQGSCRMDPVEEKGPARPSAPAKGSSTPRA